MRRTLLSTVVAASLALPSVALAVQARSPNLPSQGPHVQSTFMTRDRTLNQGTPQNPGVVEGTIGPGEINANTPGHVTGPGNARIDNDVLAPVNDVQPGRGTEDTPQSKNPKPVY